MPVSSRRRFGAAAGAVLLLAAIAALSDPVAVGPATTDGLLTALGVVAAGYLFLEARAGYRDSTGETGV